MQAGSNAMWTVMDIIPMKNNLLPENANKNNDFRHFAMAFETSQLETFVDK